MQNNASQRIGFETKGNESTALIRFLIISVHVSKYNGQFSVLILFG